MSILFASEVRLYFRELVDILFLEEYFGFEQSAIKYVTDLVHEIEKDLPHKVKKIAPTYFTRYGKNLYYCAFKKSKHTVWYVFFSIHKRMDETVYLVRYISNNHAISHFL